MILMDLVAIVIFGIAILIFNVDSFSKNSFLIKFIEFFRSGFFEWMFILNFFYILVRLIVEISKWLEANDHYIQVIINVFIEVIQLLGTEVF